MGKQPVFTVDTSLYWFWSKVTVDFKRKQFSTLRCTQNPAKHLTWSFLQNYLTDFGKSTIFGFWRGSEYLFTIRKYLFRVAIKCKNSFKARMSSKLTMKTLERRRWFDTGVLIMTFECHLVYCSYWKICIRNCCPFTNILIGQKAARYFVWIIIN